MTRLYSPSVRRGLLTVHVLVSVGWFGAVLAYLVLAIAGLGAPTPAAGGGTYTELRLLAWYAILPLSVLALLTGVLQSLGTTWGLFRHYWVVFKLALNLGSTLLLLLHMRVMDTAASTALGHAAAAARSQLVADAVVALVVLALATVLSVVKPRGLTRWGRRRERRSRPQAEVML